MHTLQKTYYTITDIVHLLFVIHTILETLAILLPLIAISALEEGISNKLTTYSYT